MHPFQIPEHAIEAFERAHRLLVTVHDLDGSLTPFLKPSRGHHCSPHCAAAKAGGRLQACLDFEIARLRPRLGGLEEGRVHVCHAGLVEWVVPVFGGARPVWVLFAGPRTAGTTLASAHREPLLPWAKSARAALAGGGRPAPVGEEEAQRILEHLRQLAARLGVWGERFCPEGKGRGARVVADRSLSTRAHAIRSFIERSHAEPLTIAMMARELALSPSRASHVVRQSCGASFRELVIQRRLQAARELLHRSGLPVQQIAAACGFAEAAHFHRLFRRRVGMTPAQYRTKGRS